MKMTRGTWSALWHQRVRSVQKDGAMLKGKGASLEEVPVSQLGHFITVVLNCNPISMSPHCHESVTQ